MFLDEVLTFLQSQGIGTVGQTLFAGSLALVPTGDGPFTVVTEYGGEPAIRAMGAVVVAEQPRAQVMVRAASYAAARSKAEAAYRACLHAVDNGAAMLGGPTVYLALTPLQPPFDAGPDENSRAQVAFNLACQRKAA